ncbi:MAG: hypothetical protein ACJA1A_003048 [Saprospiraceae bacterium]|jgi:hypothetical protein
MPHRKLHKKDLKPKMKDQVGDTIHHGKLKIAKEKYKHKSHWLELDDDDDFEDPKYKGEEE